MRLVEPLLGGVYAGHARGLSVRAAVPALVPVLAAAGLPSPAPVDPGVPVFAGLPGGMGGLASAAALAAAPIDARITVSGYEGSELLVARLLVEAGAVEDLQALAAWVLQGDRAVDRDGLRLIVGEVAVGDAVLGEGGADAVQGYLVAHLPARRGEVVLLGAAQRDAAGALVEAVRPGDDPLGAGTVLCANEPLFPALAEAIRAA